MAIQIGEKPSPTFAEPLALMSDCHRRVERFLSDLILVAKSIHGQPLAPREREALTTALRYFREAAPKHTADEEASLFPRMKNVEGAKAAFEKIKNLEADHKTAQLKHQIVEELGQKWLAENSLSEDESHRLTENLEDLQRIYEQHIHIEDHEVFPVAAKALSPSELREVGREMAERRGQPFERSIR